eukprot:gene5443-6122_t
MNHKSGISVVAQCLIVLALLQITQSRPFFQSNFYLDDSMHNRDRSIPIHAPQNYEQDESTQFKFVSIDDGGGLKVNTISRRLSKRHTTSFDDFFVMPFWEETVSTERFTVFRSNSKRKRSKWGLMGLWG